MEFEILKKNRKYFACLKSGYKCKLLIDEYSQDLTLGKHDLIVDDISVRSKYGTDLIFKLKHSFKEQEEAGICSLKHFTYNADLVQECRWLDGKWDSEEEVWIFSSVVEDQIEELDEKYNTDIDWYEVTFEVSDDSYQSAYRFYGYTVCWATGRDSGAKQQDGIILISGSFTSSGSVKNWYTTVRSGTVIRLKLPKAIYEKAKEDGWDIVLVTKEHERKRKEIEANKLAIERANEEARIEKEEKAKKDKLDAEKLRLYSEVFKFSELQDDYITCKFDGLFEFCIWLKAKDGSKLCIILTTDDNYKYEYFTCEGYYGDDYNLVTVTIEFDCDDPLSMLVAHYEAYKTRIQFCKRACKIAFNDIDMECLQEEKTYSVRKAKDNHIYQALSDFHMISEATQESLTEFVNTYYMYKTFLSKLPYHFN